MSEELVNLFDFPRDPSESGLAWDAKVQYLKMGAKRSLPKLAVQLGKSSGYVRLLERWSGKFGWSALAAQYDTYQNKLSEIKNAEEQKELAQKQREFRIKAAQKLQDTTMIALSRLQEALMSGDFIASPVQIARMITTADQLRTATLTDATEAVETLAPDMLEAIQNVYASNDDEETADES